MQLDPWAKRLEVKARPERYRQIVTQLGPRYARCTLDGYSIYDNAQRTVMEQLRDIEANMPDRLCDGSGIVLYGKPGTGKDHLLVALMYTAIIRYGFTAKWEHGPSMMASIRDRMFRDNCPESEIVGEFQSPQILVISDPIPPKGDASQHTASVLQRIIDYRYRHLLSTWVSINVSSGAEASKRLSSPTVDRLRHNSLALTCNWESYRARKGDK